MRFRESIGVGYLLCQYPPQVLSEVYPFHRYPGHRHQKHSDQCPLNQYLENPHLRLEPWGPPPFLWLFPVGRAVWTLVSQTLAASGNGTRHVPFHWSLWTPKIKKNIFYLHTFSWFQTTHKYIFFLSESAICRKIRFEELS